MDQRNSIVCVSSQKETNRAEKRGKPKNCYGRPPNDMKENIL
jgi:hypothetical protein